jgi:hypothetical protein
MSAIKEVMGGDAAFVTVMNAGIVVVLLPAVFEAPKEMA